jgi:tape measure domain-containing protein
MAVEKVEYELLLKDFLSSKIKDAQTSVSDFEGGIEKLNGTISKIGAAIGISFGIGAIKSFVGSVIEAGTKVEDATTGLTTLLGDSAQAAQVVKNTMEDATRTPFSFEGLLGANQQLIGAGVNAGKAREDVLNLANAVAAAGKGNAEFERMTQNLAQIRTTGKSTAMDIKQFGTAGINIYEVLARSTGKSVSEVKGMEVSYETLTEALKKAHAEGGIYAGGLENMQKNTSVKISNIGDTIFKTMNDIFVKTKPLTDFVMGGVADGLTFLSDTVSGLDLKGFAEETIKIFNQIKTFLEPLFTPIQNLFNTLWTGIKKVWATLSQFSTEGEGVLIMLRTALKNIIDAFTWLYEKIYNFIAGVIDVLHTIYVLLDKIGVIWAIGKSFEFVWGIIKGIGSALKSIYDYTLKPIFEAISWAYDKLKKLLGIKDVKVTAENKVVVEGEKNAIDVGAEKTNEAKKTGEIPKPETTTKTGKKEASNVTGSKSVTINIQIGKLIEQFKVETTNLHESTGKIREMVAQTLLSAVNDSQITAGV